MEKVPYKYEVPVKQAKRALRVPKELKEQLKELYGKKVVSKFSKDYVECPVRKKEVSFLICLSCPNYVRRFKGVVHCKGEPLEG